MAFKFLKTQFDISKKKKKKARHNASYVISLWVQVLSLGGRNEGEEQKKCVCVNPGRLAKGEGSGTFAEIYYHGSPEMMNASIISI